MFMMDWSGSNKSRPPRCPKLKKMQTTVLVILLLVLSCMIYLIQNLLYHRPDETVYYLLQDLAFVPISVLMVTFGLNTLMMRRERRAKLQKVSVVVNEFYAETGKV